MILKKSWAFLTLNIDMRIAILGAGFIGKNIIDKFFLHGHSVNVLDRNERPSYINQKISWIKGSLNDQQDVISTISNADIVFHLISSTVPGDVIDENEEIVNNVLDTIKLLNTCVACNVKKIIFFSSASVYGIQSVLPIGESATTNPISSHGIHKLTIEKYLQLYTYKHRLECKILRLANPYGRHQNLFGRQGFIAICLGKIISGQPIEILGDGSALRDFVYIDDVVRACALLSESDTAESLFNIGSGSGVSLNQVINELSLYFGKSVNVIYKSSRINDIHASILDIRKAEKELNFRPEFDFKMGINKTIRACLDMHPQLSQHLLPEISPSAYSLTDKN